MARAANRHLKSLLLGADIYWSVVVTARNVGQAQKDVK